MPSITLTVVVFRVFQVFSPTCSTLPSPPRAAFSPFFARRFKLIVLGAADFLARRFGLDFREGRFLEDGRLAAERFFGARRLADFLVAAMAASRLG